MILIGKLRLCQLAEKDTARILVPFSNAEIASLWAENDHWQRAWSNFFWKRLLRNIPKARDFSKSKRINCILSHIIKGLPYSGAPTFYTNAKKSGRTGYNWGKISRVAQSTYD